jgi:hypothetical protein
MITAEQIYNATRDGLDIILSYFPDAEKCINKPSHKFKLREGEKTASASMKRSNKSGLWIVTDFGDEHKGKSAIDLVMEIERLEFPQALNFLAQQYNIATESKPQAPITAKISSRPANEEEEPGKFYYDYKDFSEAEIKQILSTGTIKFLGKDWMNAAVAIFKKYNFRCLKSYSMCKLNKDSKPMLYTFESTEAFPIYVWETKDFKKLYKPKETEYPRFLYDGNFDNNFLWGYEVANKAWAEITNISDEEEPESDKPKKKKPQKLQAVAICSGGSDALNLACLNQYPIWMNSETAKLHWGHHKNLQAIAEVVYNLPDIDSTGLKAAHNLATEYLDIHTIYLPAEMGKYNAPNGKPKKDLRDFLNTYTSKNDFFDLLKVAYPYRFWDERHQFNKQGEYTGINYDVRNKRLYNFLSKNGFYRYKSEAHKDGYIFIRINGNIVSEITAKDIRDFVNNFLEARKFDDKLLDVFLRTTQLSESSLSNLPYIEIDFTDYDVSTQWFFIDENVIEVSDKGITEHKPGTVKKYVWEKEVIRKKYKPDAPQFTITGNDIELQSPCMVLRYFVNASRVFWRKELEENLHQAGDHQAQEKYIADNKFNIAGALLDEEEKAIQKLHLINKIYSIGYLLHTYKNSSKAWAVWAMDNKISDASESHGGSGKSVGYKGILYFKNNVQLEGRNPRLTDNPHVYENITEHSDIVLVDDASRYIKFDFFFSAITGPLNVNPKNNKQYVIDFARVPKFIFTSNFPPYGADPSIERRLLYTVFSDYYHYNRLSEYREERKVSDDFGMNLYDDFDSTEWSRTIDFYMQALHFYLSTADKINPPMDNVNKRSLKSQAGDNFFDWADVYFGAESGKLNQEFIRKDAFEDVLKFTGVKFTPQQFKHSLKAWCQYNGYELNPKEFTGESGRQTKIVDRTTKDGNTIKERQEIFFIKTPSAEQPEEQTDLPF